MSTPVGYIAPFINEDFYVTSIFGEQRPSHTHKGIDISTGRESPEYAIDNVRIIRKDYDSGGYGYYIIMKNDTTNMGYLYAHLRAESPLQIGQIITPGTLIGYEGSTGSSTGYHLHLEMQVMNGDTWSFGDPLSKYTNPATYMGINNVVDGIAWIYRGSPTPPQPPQPTISGKHHWQKFLAKKIKINY